jgi:hypothetical protein
VGVMRDDEMLNAELKRSRFDAKHFCLIQALMPRLSNLASLSILHTPPTNEFAEVAIYDNHLALLADNASLPISHGFTSIKAG